MSAFGGLILTNRGRNLQAKIQAGDELKYTRIALGDGNLGSTPIVDLTSLKNEVKSLFIQKLKVLTQGRALIGTVLSNQDLSTGFYFREIGVFALDPDIGEVLYCYGNSGGLAEYIPAGGGPDVIEKNIDIQTLVGNTQNVSAVIDSSLVYVTQSELTDALENISVPVTSVNAKTGDITLTADDVGAETPAESQAKANSALQSAKDYTDQEVGELEDKTRNINAENIKLSDGKTVEVKFAENAQNVKQLDDKIGILSTKVSPETVLNTTSQNLSGAINEIKDEVDEHKADDVHLISGLIVMWSGLISAIPLGWNLCDGQNGTPDLRDRFIMGATSDSDVGQTGGENEIILTTAQMPFHKHTGSTNHTGEHTHTMPVTTSNSAGSQIVSLRGSNTYFNPPTSSSGSHSHTVTIGSAGGGQAHENRPAYYKLAFIMKE